MTLPNVDIINRWVQHTAFIETLRIIPWSHSDTVISDSLQNQIDPTLLSLTENDAIRQSSILEYETTETLTQLNVGIINPWNQHSIETLEVISWTHFLSVIASSTQTLACF